MGRIKESFLFCGLTSSAFISPILMIISLTTNYWLFSREKVIIAQSVPVSINGYLPLDFIEANYGLWKMCKITDTSRKSKCEQIKNFQGSESEIGETIKKQIDHCIIPILLALLIMIISVILHTYAITKKKQYYLFLTSGCLAIFAGLSSLTGLIIFISAVNGAVDNKMVKNSRSRDEEPPFKYGYGFSFYCAVLSFLFQEINGICNIYWYMGYHKKKRFQQQTNYKTNTQKPIIPPIPTHIKKESENHLAPNFARSNLRNSKSNIQIIITDESDGNTQCDSLTNKIEAVRNLPSISPSLANHLHAKSKFMEYSLPAYEEDEKISKTSKTSNENAIQTNDEEVSDIKIKNTTITSDRIPKRPVLDKSASMVSPRNSVEDSYVSSSISSFTSSTSTLKVKSDTNSSEPDLFQNQNNFFVPDDLFRFNTLQKSCRHYVPSPIEEPNELKAKFYKLKDNNMSKKNISKINSIDTSDLNRHLIKHCSCHPTSRNMNTVSRQLKSEEPFSLKNTYNNSSFPISQRKALSNLKKMSSHPNSQSISIVNERDLVTSSKEMTGYSRSKSDYNFRGQNYPFFVRLPIYQIKDNIQIDDSQKPYNNSNKSTCSSKSRPIKYFPTNPTEYKTKHPNSKAMLNAANEAALATETYLNRRCDHQTNSLSRGQNCRTMPDLFWPREIVASPSQMPMFPQKNYVQINRTQVNKNHRVYRIRKKVPLLKQSSYNTAFKQTDIHAQESTPVDLYNDISPANDYGWKLKANVTFKDNFSYHHHDGNTSKITKKNNDAQFFKLKRTTSV